MPATVSRATYGKKRPGLLPLTAEQFRRMDIFEPLTSVVVKERPSSIKKLPSGSDLDPEDSPLSDAEPSKLVAPLIPVPRLGRESPHGTDRSDAKADQQVLARRKAQGSNLRDNVVKKTPQQTSIAPNVRTQRQDIAPERTLKRSRGAQELTRQSGRSPGELRLVAGTVILDRQKSLPKGARAIVRPDPIISSSQQSPSQGDSSDADVEISKTKRKVSLSALRKRLKTALPGHRPLKDMKCRRNDRARNRLSEQTRGLLGDGFDENELTIDHSRRKLQQQRRQRPKPIWEGIQALSLTTAPSPDVDFIRTKCEREPIVIPNNALTFSVVNENDDSYHDVDMAEEDGVGPSEAHRGEQDFIAFQLSLVTAPKRAYSITSDSDPESDDDFLDDEAAESYMDRANHQDEEMDESVHDNDESAEDFERNPSPEVPAVRNCNFGHAMRISNNIATAATFHAPSEVGATGGMRRSSGRHLMEVDEPIQDDKDQDMLLDDTYCLGPISTSESQLVAKMKQYHETRSILQPSAPRILPAASGPEYTALNTRHNSRKYFDQDLLASDAEADPGPGSQEQSHYFTSTQDRLSATLAQPQRIIRKKSNTPYLAYTYEGPLSERDVEVPYSGFLTIAETSPAPLGYADEKQLHVLKRRGGTALEAAAGVTAGKRDLSVLTRRVNRENGTLSQSVRRRLTVGVRGVTTVDR